MQQYSVDRDFILSAHRNCSSDKERLDIENKFPNIFVKYHVGQTFTYMLRKKYLLAEVNYNEVALICTTTGKYHMPPVKVEDVTRITLTELIEAQGKQSYTNKDFELD